MPMSTHAQSSVGRIFRSTPLTHRGNRLEDIFYNDEDRRGYLDWLKQYRPLGQPGKGADRI